MEVEYCEKGLLENIRKPSAAPFLVKTYMVVEDPASDEVISWNNEGTSFVVWQPAVFATDLLPTLFKHSNFSSFVRQLNTYGFRKVTTSRWEFSNDTFRKGGKDLLHEIRRKKGCRNKQTQTKESIEDQQSQRSSSTCSSAEYNWRVIDDNKRLKKENDVLSSELLIMKNKCKHLLDLVTIYTVKGDDEDEKRPKLFGVRLQVQPEMEMEMKKRKKVEISESDYTSN